MTSESWSWFGKVCVVTGGTGFIGSHLCAALYDLGARVLNVDIERPHSGTLFSILNEGREIPVISADLAEPESIGRVVECEPEVMFHLAANPYAPFTTNHPSEAYRSNVVTTANMLEAARRARTERFILASSACFFGATTASPLREDSKLSFAEHYYTHTKRQAEDQVRSYTDFYALPATICRFVNVYGPGDRHFGRIVPAICKQLVMDEAPTVRLARGTGESIFEFLYVEDAVSGLVAAGARQPQEREIFHFAPGAEARVSVSELVQRLCVLYDGRVREILMNCANPEKVVRKYLDSSETRSVLGWAPDWSLDGGLTRTLGWYRENLRRLTPCEYPNAFPSLR